MGLLPDPLYEVMAWGNALALIGATAFFFRYKFGVRRQKDEILKRLARGLVYRDTASKPKRVVKAFELDAEFLSELPPDCKVCSLGEYLSSLRFYDEGANGDGNMSTVQEMLQKELYTVMASLLMKSLGETLGAALLPVLGLAENAFESVSSKMVKHVVENVVVNATSGNWDPTYDMGAMPFCISDIVGLSNFNHKIVEGGTLDVMPLEWMERGEVAYDPTFYTPPTQEGGEAAPAAQKVLVPNPFVIEEHFNAAISGMEERIRSSGDDTYDPEETKMPEPVPINFTILPGLHMGCAGGHWTHTRRECLLNRLFAILLTKLSYNYDLRANGKDADFFVVRAYGTDCTCPDELMEVLCDNGHSIEVCPRATVTTFGVNLCVKEEDGSWKNIPVGMLLRTGYESAGQRPSYYHLLHGGLDLQIEGPLVGSKQCNIQFYMAIEGMCGWHSNHNPDVPWQFLNPTADVYCQKDALQAMRLCGIVACVYNQIGTEMDLPFGGYGLIGVCNDTAALVDRAVRGETNLYPLMTTGRFLSHTVNFLTKYYDKMVSGCSDSGEKMTAAAEDVLRLASSALNIESDIHCAPNKIAETAKRFAASYPKPIWQINRDSENVMKEILQQNEDIKAKISKV